MFQWDKSINKLDVPAEKVHHLFRSMRDVQLALPGLPAQESSAYLCQYQAPGGVGTTVVFHLHKSGQLAFYVDTPREVPAAKADAILDQTLVFVESMGFLMTDLDIHLLGASDREMLWLSLPLQNGLQMAERIAVPKPPVPPAPIATVSSPAPADVAPVQKSLVQKSALFEGKATSSAPLAASEQLAASSTEAATNETANVEDLLAAVEELRARRPGVRSRKKPPSPEELKRRRQGLRESIGRVLASL